MRILIVQFDLVTLNLCHVMLKCSKARNPTVNHFFHTSLQMTSHEDVIIAKWMIRYNTRNASNHPGPALQSLATALNFLSLENVERLVSVHCFTVSSQSVHYSYLRPY